MRGVRQIPTLCWGCKNAVPNAAGTKGCSWSRRFEPVYGWDAKPTVLQWSHGKNAGDASFIVRKCPEFVGDAR